MRVSRSRAIFAHGVPQLTGRCVPLCPRRRPGGAGGVHSPDPVRGGTRDHPAGPQGSDSDPHDSGPDLRPDDRDGDGAQAGVFLGRQSGGGVAAPCAGRGRARLAGAARDRRAQSRGDGQRLRGGGGGDALRIFSRVSRLGPAGGQPRHTLRHLSLHRRGAGVRAGAAAGRDDHPRAERRTAKAT